MSDEVVVQSSEEEDYESLYTGEQIDGAIGDVRTKSAGWDAKYSKPASGIPSTDLSAEVQASLAKAETAIQQQADLDGYATTESLSAHTGNTDIHIQTGEKAAWNTKYSKPSGGIPSTDLASGVQTALGLASTAIQPAAFNSLSSTVNSISTSISNNAISQLASLPSSGTALTGNRIYKITNTTIGNYSFVAPANGGWAHGIFTTASTGTRSFANTAKFINGNKPTKADTTYEFDVLDNVWAFAEVKA